MATNKHAIIRYQALDKCFRNLGRKYFMDDLIKACNQAIYDFSGNPVGVKRRQVFDDIKFMESTSGYSIDLIRHKDGKRVFYRYFDTSFSINSQPLNELEAVQFKEALHTLKRFQGLPQFEWIGEIVTKLDSSFNLKSNEASVIEFDQNPFLKGLELIAPLYYAIIDKRAIEINYKGIKSNKLINYNFSPHYLKQYNSRWFLFGFAGGRNDITNLALDRITDISESTSSYIPSKLNYEDYFHDIVGVTLNKDDIIEIKMIVNDDLMPYIQSKPIHGSQILKQINGENILKIKVIPNYELESVILSYGEGLKVITPIALKLKIESRIKQILK